MKVIYFKNGLVKNINDDVAKILKEKILKQDFSFLILSDDYDNPFLFINISEIVYIN